MKWSLKQAVRISFIILDLELLLVFIAKPGICKLFGYNFSDSLNKTDFFSSRFDGGVWESKVGAITRQQSKAQASEQRSTDLWGSQFYTD